MSTARLFRPMDNSPLIVFRIIFGALISLECFGAIATGWVRENVVEPTFTFNFIGFEWLQFLVGPQMYLYFALMGILGICISLGYRYRFCMPAFTLLWTGAYLLQKTAYNNHYYLLILLALIMCFMPANSSHSLDMKQGRLTENQWMPAYVKWIFVLQLFLVYSYAAIAKLYPDWTDLTFIRFLLQTKADYPLIGDVLQSPSLHSVITWGGLLFDALIIPALLWKPSRIIAFFVAIVFHLFNSIVFQIGIFPYLSLALTLFFFSPGTIRKLFFKQTPLEEGDKPAFSPPKAIWIWGWAIYFLIQTILPLRHHMIPGEVLWTEEGHRMSWRMMLRARYGSIQFEVVNKETGARTVPDISQMLSKRQQIRIAGYPDLIWQFAQRLAREYALDGQDVAVYANAKVSINGRPLEQFTDPRVDLAGEDWDPYRHHHWILPSPIHESHTLD
ncbi:MAG: HTTM domain-containing protein [Bacteroidia bacterium]|nr:HTTM domain-containing protein [Bacteroidia bacterium]